MNKPRRTRKKKPLDISWSDRARSDLRKIGEFIAKDNPQAALRWIEKLAQAVDRLATLPTSGRIVPEFQRKDLREVIVHNYRIVYRIKTDEVEIVTVFEGHRSFPAVFS